MKNSSSRFTGILGALSIALLAIVTLAMPATIQAQAAPAAFHAVSRGSTFHVSLPYDTAFKGALDYLNSHEMTIDTANQPGHTIVTSPKTLKRQGADVMQTVQIVFDKDADGKNTTMHVKVVAVTRTGSADAWGNPTIDWKQSAILAKQIQGALNPAPTAVAKT